MKRDGCKPGYVLFLGKCVPIPKNEKELYSFLEKQSHIVSYPDLERLLNASHRAEFDYLKKTGCQDAVKTKIDNRNKIYIKKRLYIWDSKHNHYVWENCKKENCRSLDDAILCWRHLNIKFKRGKR